MIHQRNVNDINQAGNIFFIMRKKLKTSSACAINVICMIQNPYTTGKD